MQDKQNNESLQFQENLIFPRIKAQLIRDYNFLKNNLSLLIILPSVLGGLWQIIELFSIDLPYIRFFSINQMVPDGVLILFLLFYIFSICSLIRYIPQHNFTVDNFKRTSFIGFMIGISIPLFMVIILFSGLYDAQYDSFLSIVKGFFKLALVAFFASITISQTELYILAKKNILKKLITKFGFRLLIFIIISIAFLLPFLKIITTTRNLINIPKNLNNFNSVKEKLIKKYNLNSQPKLLYFNKDYLFYEIKIGDETKILIYETKNLFSDDSKDSKDE